MKSAALGLSVLLLSSCNKKDIEEIQNDIDSQNGNINNIENVIVTDDGIHGYIKGNRQSDSVAFYYDYDHEYIGSANSGAKVGPSGSNYIKDNGDGTYDVKVKRYLNTSQVEYSTIEVYDYDPSVGVSSAEFYAYTYHENQAEDIKKTFLFWQEGYLDDTEDDITVNAFSIDMNNRSVNIDLTIQSTEDDGINSSDNPTTVTMKFAGTLNWNTSAE